MLNQSAAKTFNQRINQLKAKIKPTIAVAPEKSSKILSKSCNQFLISRREEHEIVSSQSAENLAQKTASKWAIWKNDKIKHLPPLKQNIELCLNIHNKPSAQINAGGGRGQKEGAAVEIQDIIAATSNRKRSLHHENECKTQRQFGHKAVINVQQYKFWQFGNSFSSRTKSSANFNKKLSKTKKSGRV